MCSGSRDAMSSGQLSYVTEKRAVVISPSGKTNALGRAMCLAELASEVFDSVHLYAPDDGRLWSGAKRASQPVRRFGSPAELVAELRRERQAHLGLDAGAQLGYLGLAAGARSECDGGSLFVWAVKPLSSSWGAAQAIRRALPMSLTVLDLDDADEALSSQFRAASPANRLRLHPWSPLNPRRIRNTLASALGEVDAVTYASEALRGTLGFDFDGPTLCVPHPRRRAASRSTSPRGPSEQIHLGFLGTVRRHKGLGYIEALLLEDSRYVLHVFRGALPSPARERLSAHLVEHEVDAPMADLYGEIDVVVLPQDRTPGAQVQLPAKLLDAMSFGKPIVASPTAAIVEAAAETVLYVVDWGSQEEVRSKILRAHADGSTLGQAALTRFERQLASEAQLGGLREFVRTIEAPRKARKMAQVGPV
jgi:glycosyltransferase involved in cell wall biosynthesis